MFAFLGSLAHICYENVMNRAKKKRLHLLIQQSQHAGDITVSGYPNEYIKDSRIMKVFEQNRDVVGWIKLKETDLNYPVFQKKTDAYNEFYVRHGLDKEYAIDGVPFVDYRADLQKPSKNIVIYAHNMAKSIDMFGVLRYYNKYDRFCENSAEKAVDFYKKHPIVDFVSVYGGTRYRIVSVLLMDGEHPDFNYSNFIESSDDFNEFINQIKNRSLMNIDADINIGDNFLTLSTCSYELASGKLRIAVVARALRAGEDDAPDPVENNKDALLPKCWYGIYGGSPPIFERKDYSATMVSAADAMESQHWQSKKKRQISIKRIKQRKKIERIKKKRKKQLDESIDKPKSNKKGKEIFGEDEVVMVNGSKQKKAAYETLCAIVQAEIGSSFPAEAIKAQTLVSHSYLLFKNKKGESPSVFMKPPSERVKEIVKQVMHLGVFFNGEIAGTLYHSCSAGRTNSSEDIWHKSPYLVSVESPHDKLAPNYKQTKVFTRKQLKERFQNGMGINLEKNSVPVKKWFRVINRTKGGYNKHMIIAGHEMCYVPFLKGFKKITGSLIRQMVLPEIGSSKFEVYYNEDRDLFKFVSFGCGHGVGLSQWGAKFYAEIDGWDFEMILEHFFPGTEIAPIA
ncbi:MAG: SpoIID/LytB domain-containing protein [Oscillospiraceae bacterium]|jgi:SrtB family sortase|nr:SpoIID/LytB domain-containing protein [Oscillospiraceae bacterium]